MNNLEEKTLRDDFGEVRKRWGIQDGDEARIIKKLAREILITYAVLIFGTIIGIQAYASGSYLWWANMLGFWIIGCVIVLRLYYRGYVIENRRWVTFREFLSKGRQLEA